ncbi:MAG: hypothetical protein DWP97_14085 [Calditrichaeota bacterium]|nr:MAG: hypothetical protein DWP97_14085 [Calditrichota bacterium]
MYGTFIPMYNKVYREKIIINNDSIYYHIIEVDSGINLIDTSIWSFKEIDGVYKVDFTNYRVMNSFRFECDLNYQDGDSVSYFVDLYCSASKMFNHFELIACRSYLTLKKID